ncbi:MAG: FHA domain-containing protein [Gemmatimonadaceae bacterium]
MSALIIVVLATALLLTVAVWMVSVFRRPSPARHEPGEIQLIFPGGSKTVPIEEDRSPEDAEEPVPADGNRRPQPVSRSMAEALEISAARGRPAAQPDGGSGRNGANGAGGKGVGVDEDRALGGETVQFRRPQDEAVQLLPGRLEVLDGEHPNEEVRFVRMPGELPQVTFGREAGPPHRHVRLRTMTASRLHARMTYRNGRWTITNLSATNPVHINDIAIESVGEGRVLDDGDRIEMGEIVFRFRSH